MQETSSFCASNECVEVTPWRKSSFSYSNCNCVEVAAWEKSSFSKANGNCVEVAAWEKSSFSVTNGGCVETGAWSKSSLSIADKACVEAEGAVISSHSNSGNCVEAAHAGHVIAVRDTKDRTIPPVQFSLAEWQTFIDDVKAGEYPLIDGVDDYRIGHLVFTRNEWDAFIMGAQNPDENGRGEFDLSPELEAELAGAV